MKGYTFFREWRSFRWQGNGLGFISEESIGSKNVFVYSQNEKNLFEQPFIEFINQPAQTCGDNPITDLWGDYYKLLVSSVVISVTLIGQSVSSDIDSSSKKGWLFGQTFNSLSN